MTHRNIAQKPDTFKPNQIVVYTARCTIGLKGNLTTGQSYIVEEVLEDEVDMDTIIKVSDSKGGIHYGFWHEFTKL